jgi:hypothetical protein
MAQATDNFERSSLGANWTTAEGAPQIYDSSDAGGGSDNGNFAIYNAGAYGADQYCRIRISALGGSEITAGVRCTTGIDTAIGYLLQTDGATFFRIARLNDGDFDELVSVASPLPVLGDTIKLTIVGTQLRAYINEVEVVALAVTNNELATGQPGMGFFLSTFPPLSRAEQWWGGDGVGVGVFSDVLMNATTAPVATIVNKLTLSRPLSLATAVTVATIAHPATFRRLLYVASATIATLVQGGTEMVNMLVTVLITPTLSRTKVQFVVLTTSVLSTGAMAFGTLYSRFMNAFATTIATITKFSPINQILNATEVSIATLAKLNVKIRTLNATEVSIATLAKTKSVLQVLLATAVTVPTLSRIASFFRTLAATMIGSPSISRSASGASANPTTLRVPILFPSPVLRIRLPLGYE